MSIRSALNVNSPWRINCNVFVWSGTLMYTLLHVVYSKPRFICGLPRLCPFDNLSITPFDLKYHALRPPCFQSTRIRYSYPGMDWECVMHVWKNIWEGEMKTLKTDKETFRMFLVLILSKFKLSFISYLSLFDWITNSIKLKAAGILQSFPWTTLYVMLQKLH